MKSIKQYKTIVILLSSILLLMAVVIGILLIRTDDKKQPEMDSQKPENEGKTFSDKEKATYTDFKLGLEMVRIPGQTFLMGNYDGNPEGTEDELPVHEVKVNTFYITKFEITQKEYEKVMGVSPSYFKGDKKPVTNIDWYDAIKFCNALSSKEKLQKCYEITYDDAGKVIDAKWNKPANGYRLPTEAEHECASQFEFSGQPLDATQYGWFFINGERTIHNAGQKLPNKYGLYDILGNVWEWCWDIYGPYDGSFQDNPSGAINGEKRTSKGGSYTTENTMVRASDRGNGKPTLKGRDLGLRVVRNGN
jgi:formylglycine-generating enzyme required for sulfatase activity